MKEQNIITDKKLCWMRDLVIKLKSKIYNVDDLVFGTRNSKNEYLNDQLNIEVNGTKQISSMLNQGTVKISNLTYAEIYRIIEGQFYEIEIWAGYRSQNLERYFKGEIAYISDEITMKKDNTCTIIFASSFVARYSQSRININLIPNMSMYGILNYICLQKGIDTSTLSEDLKQRYIKEIISAYDTPANFIESLSNNSNDLISNIDSSLDNQVINMSTIKDKRQIVIDPSTINFSKGNPSISKDGLKICLFPTFNFIPGDIIYIDNSYVNRTETSLEGAQKNWKNNYLSTNGGYMIKEINFIFQNRGNTFELDIQAIGLNIINNIVGGNVK